MATTGVVGPGIEAGCAVKLPCERHERSQVRVTERGTEHGLSGDMVERPDGIDGQDGRTRVELSGGAQHPGKGFGASSRAQPKLVRETGTLEVRRKGLSQRADAAAVGLLQRRPMRKADKTGGGRSACARQQAAQCKSWVSHSSSRRIRRCSLVAPDGPAAAPRLAVRKHATNAGSGKGQGPSSQNAAMSWGASRGVPQLGEGCGGEGCKWFCNKCAAGGRKLANVDKGCGTGCASSESSWGTAERGREAAEPAESSSGQAPRAKRSQRRSSSAGGMSESPPERWRSMRGARQKKSFQPRSSCTGDSRSAISCNPARKAVRRAPRRRVGTPCNVRTRRCKVS